MIESPINVTHLSPRIRRPRTRRTFRGALAESLTVFAGAWITEISTDGTPLEQRHDKRTALVCNAGDTLVTYPAELARDELCVLRIARVISDTFDRQTYAVEVACGDLFRGPCFVMRRHR